MLVSDAITAIRAGTIHDADTQVTDTQITVWVGQEYRRLRRWLCVHAPALCETTVSSIAVTAATISKSTSLPTFERVVCVRKLENGIYYPISTEARVNMLLSSGGTENGTYEVSYLTGAPASITTGTPLDLPAGLEDVLIERCSARVRLRMPGEESLAAQHDRRAAELLEESASTLKGRTGAHSGGGLRRERYISLVWYETPTSIEIRTATA